MGQDKAWLKVGGQPVIERVLARVKPLTDDLLLSANTPENYRALGLRLVPDIYPTPLGGIYSVLAAARYPHVLVVACDMPFLQSDLLRYLVTLAPTADVIIPRPKHDRLEPLLAVYGQNCRPAIEAQLQAGQPRIIDFFDAVSVRYVEADEIAPFDPNLASFINLNTPDDWRRAQAMT